MCRINVLVGVSILVGNIFHIKPDRKSTKTYIKQCSTIFTNSFLDEVYELEKEEEDESYSYLKWVYLLIICLILTIAYFIKKYVKRHTGVYKTKGQEILEGFLWCPQIFHKKASKIFPYFLP